MPLSKQRDKERKRLARLENKKVQPNLNIQSGYDNWESDVIKPTGRVYNMTDGSYTEVDADGNAIYED